MKNHQKTAQATEEDGCLRSGRGLTATVALRPHETIKNVRVALSTILVLILTSAAVFAGPKRCAQSTTAEVYSSATITDTWTPSEAIPTGCSKTLRLLGINHTSNLVVAFCYFTNSAAADPLDVPHVLVAEVGMDRELGTQFIDLRTSNSILTADSHEIDVVGPFFQCRAKCGSAGCTSNVTLEATLLP